jgi:hypothetical protein
MNEFFRILRKYKHGLNLQILLRALIRAFLCLMAGIHVWYLVWLYLPAQDNALVWLNVGLKIVVPAVGIFLIVLGVKRFLSYLDTARWMDRLVEHDDDLYQNLYELNRQQEEPSVLDALAGIAEKRLGGSGYKLPKLMVSSQLFFILFVIAGIGSVWALSGDSFSLALKQLWTNKAESVDYKKTIDLSPGNKTVGKGQQVVIRVLDPDPRLHHRLFYKWDSQWRELALTDNTYSFNSLEYSFSYYVQNEQAKSNVYRITCLDVPFVRNWEVQYQYPAYTGLGTVTDSLSYGNIEAFKHTRAILSIETNIPVNDAVMRFSDGSSRPMQRVDETNFSTQLEILTPQTWYLELTDALGRKSQPEEKTISMIPDQPPEVRIVFPGQDVTLNQNLILLLIVSADDDFGLRNLSLHYQVNEAPERFNVLQSVIPGKMLTLDYSFDMTGLGLFPGDNVFYWAEIYDNSPDQQKAISARYKAHFPSIEEIYKEIENQEKEKTEDLQSTLKESKDLQKEFEEKRRELLKDKDVQWDDKKQLEKMLQDQDKLNQQVDNIAEDFQQMIDKMQTNTALSAETLEKMQKIQELMQEISNDELREAMSKFDQALQSLRPEDIRKAMENMKFSMEDFSKKIDQTLKLLESIKKEQAMDKALQISKEMEKMQSEINDKTGDPKENNQRLAEEQSKVKDKLDQLKKQMEETDKLLDPAKDSKVKQDLNELKQDMQKDNLDKDINSSEQQLSQNQSMQAKSEQEKALQKMRRYTLRLADMKSSMSGSGSQEVKNAIQNAIRELLIFSKQHEELKERYGADPYTIISDLIAQYEGIQVVLNRLFSVPQVTMVLPPKFYIDLTDTNNSYRDVFINVNEMQYSQVPERLESILKGLNLMSYDLIQVLNNPSGGAGSGMGMQSLMQMLGQMSQEQMALNSLAEQLMMQMQQQGGQMNAALQNQIQKLANDQQRLADNLKRALQNNPEAQKQGNSIKQIIEEAEAVSRQLKNNQLSDDLLRQQDNIISRLLDAQRSINKREYSEKRKGETADPNIRQLDTTTDYESLRRKTMLDDSYRLFPPSYQQVILKYLKLLNE